MSRKDYILIAEVLRVLYHRAKLDVKNPHTDSVCVAVANTILNVSEELADSLARDNSGFRREHFLAVIRGEKELLSHPPRRR